MKKHFLTLFLVSISIIIYGQTVAYKSISAEIGVLSISQEEYKEDAKDWERMNDWIERIGWFGFFEKTGLPFTKFHIDNWRGARNSLNASAHIRF